MKPFTEYADKQLIYGLTPCNALDARSLYHESFPKRNIPSQKTFQRVDHRLRENAQIQLTLFIIL